jgi:hypothetical protein
MSSALNLDLKTLGGGLLTGRAPSVGQLWESQQPRVPSPASTVPEA